MESKSRHPSFTYSGGGSYVKGFHVFIKAASNILNSGNASARCFFSRFFEEPLPYVVMESAFLGTVPVALKVDSMPEIMEDTPIEELADRVRALVSRTLAFLRHGCMF